MMCPLRVDVQNIEDWSQKSRIPGDLKKVQERSSFLPSQDREGAIFPRGENAPGGWRSMWNGLRKLLTFFGATAKVGRSTVLYGAILPVQTAQLILAIFTVLYY